MIEWIEDDGGRAAAGYRGSTGDCACRAIAIATGLPYQEIYDELVILGKRERWRIPGKKQSHPRTGVWPKTVSALLAGWTWVPTMEVGSGCQVHLRADELPPGRIIVRLSKHYAAVIDGVLHDTSDCSRDGTRCVYGYWTQNP